MKTNPANMAKFAIRNPMWQRRLAAESAAGTALPLFAIRHSTMNPPAKHG
jgi:hypothetical protein